MKARAPASSGLGTGATASAAQNSSTSSLSPRVRRSFRWTFTAFATLTRRSARFGSLARATMAGSRMRLRLRVFAKHLATVHVPRRFYTQVLPGIPTIRVFEALACGIPLVSAPWDDCEHLFRVGEDFLMVGNGAEMTRVLTDLKNDRELRASLVRSGLESIRNRHTCAHRVQELLNIVEQVRAPALESAA